MTSDSKESRKTFYVTVPIYYPNANLHMGHVYTTTLADILARFYRAQGKETYFLTGADENTGKVIKSAEAEGKSVEQYLDEITKSFQNLFALINISSDSFIRTTDKEKHWPGVIKMWNALLESGDIYKNTYEGLYCPSCEAFYTEKDLVEGKCAIHGIVPEKLKEENYFFRLSKYAPEVAEKIENGEFRIIPESRKNEILAFMKRGVEDVSFSRPISVVPHGIPVPGDPSQVIYVWCDALTNYISALGYGSSDESLYNKFWPADAQIMGKDILRFHALIWPAMLLSAGLPVPKSLLVHGMITSGGVKMSKSIGNVIDPMEVISEFGVEALRYYVAREISTFEDGDMTLERFKEAYNANLANGLGNLVSRVMKMASTNLSAPVNAKETELPREYTEGLEAFEIQKTANFVWDKIQDLDKIIQETEPFKIVKEDKEKGVKIITELVEKLASIAQMLKPFMPTTSEAISLAIKENTMPITLFPERINLLTVYRVLTTMNFKFFDAHCQLQFPEFKDDLPEVLERMKENEIAAIVVGTDYDMSKKGIELAEKHDFLWATVGVHPNEKEEVFDYEKFKELAKHPKVVAVGECGLDYYRNDKADESEIDRQRSLFKKQIELAIEMGKPLMVHSRNAYEDIIEILTEFKKEFSNLKGDIHFYSGNLEQAKKFIDLGFTISFAGPITFARDYDEVIKNAPLASILAETDAPFAAPAPFRGKRNEPTYVMEVVKKIAEVRGEDLELLRKNLVQNTARMFSISNPGQAPLFHGG